MEIGTINNLNNSMINTYATNANDFVLQPVDKQAMLEAVGQDETRVKQIKEDAVKFKYSASEVVPASNPYSYNYNNRPSQVVNSPTTTYGQPVNRYYSQQQATVVTDNIDQTKQRFKVIREKAYKEAEEYLRQNNVKTENAHRNYTKNRNKRGFWSKVSGVLESDIVSKAGMLFGVIALQTIASFLQEEYRDTLQKRKKEGASK